MKHFWAKCVILSLAIGVMPMSICAQESANKDGEIEAYNESDEGYWAESNGVGNTIIMMDVVLLGVTLELMMIYIFLTKMAGCKRIVGIMK